MQIIKNNNQSLIKKIPGNYYVDGLCGTSTATSPSSVANGRLDYFAISIPESLFVTEIAFSQTIAAVGVNYKANLYSSDFNTLLPKSKLLGADQIISADAIGTKSLVVNQILKGLYYIGITRSSGASTTLVTKGNVFQLSATLGLGSSAVATSINLGTRLSTFTYANDLPNPATQDTPSITYLVNAIPVFWYKI